MDLNLHLELSRSEDLLKKLVAKAARQEGPRAFVRLTCGAHQHEGIPLKIQSLHGEEHLALYQLDGGVRGQEALVILPLNSIGSLTLLNLRDHIDLLSRRGPWSVDVSSAPSAQEVRRRWQRLVEGVGRPEQMLHLELSPQQAQEPAVQVTLMKMIERLQVSVQALQSQPETMADWSGLRLITVQFEDNSGLLLQREDEELRITVGYALDAATLAQMPSALSRALNTESLSPCKDA